MYKVEVEKKYPRHLLELNIKNFVMRDDIWPSQVIIFKIPAEDEDDKTDFIIVDKRFPMRRIFAVGNEDPLEQDDVVIIPLGSLGDIDDDLIGSQFKSDTTLDEDIRKVLTLLIRETKYYQSAIIEGLHKYFGEIIEEDSSNYRAYCAGLVSLWLFCCSRSLQNSSDDSKACDDIHWFLSTLEAINKENVTPEERQDIERFFWHIKQLSTPFWAMPDTFPGDLHLLFEDTKGRHPYKTASYGGVYSLEEIETFLNDVIQPGSMTYIGTLVDLPISPLKIIKAPHALGLIKKDDGSFIYYDSNNRTKAFTVANAHLAALEFFRSIKCSDMSLRQPFGFKIFDWDVRSDYPSREAWMNKQFHPWLTQLVLILGCPELLRDYAAQFPEIVNIPMRDELPRPMLEVAVSYGHSEPFIEELLRSGADPNTVSNGEETPLYEAVVNRQLNIVRLLVKYGADPRKKGKYGLWPIEKAIDDGYIDTVEIILSEMQKRNDALLQDAEFFNWLKDAARWSKENSQALLDLLSVYSPQQSSSKSTTLLAPHSVLFRVPELKTDLVSQELEAPQPSSSLVDCSA
jgi:hypothetical protein